MVGRRVVVSVAATVGVLLLVASAAWACATVNSPYLNNLDPSRGEVGTSVRVSGGNWAAEQDLDLEWRDGHNRALQTLATVTTDREGQFATSVTVPSSAEPGSYYVGAVQDGSSEAAAFEVTAQTAGDDGEQTADDGGQEGSTSGSTSGQDAEPESEGGSDGTTSQTVEGGSNDGVQGSDGSQTTQQPEGSEGSEGSDGGEVAEPSDGQPAEAPPVIETGPAEVAVDQPASARPAGSAVGDSSQPTLEEPAEPVAAAVPAGLTRGIAAPTGDGDALDAGDDGRVPAGVDRAADELWASQGDAAGADTVGLSDLSERDDPSPLTAGVGLLLAGALVLFAAFTAADLLRRPAGRRTGDGDGDAA